MVNLTYWRANFEVAILFSDFSLGLKPDILGSFGTFPARIGGFFLNVLSNHFGSNLIFFFLFLRSIWPTGELILRSISFSLTFFLVQKVTLKADIGGIFVNELTKHFKSNLLFFFVFLRSTWLTREEFLYLLSFSFTFFSVPKLTLLAVLAHF